MRAVQLFLLAAWAARLGLGGLHASPAPERSFTLEEAQKLSLLNNAEYLSAQQDVLISRERVAEARFRFFPEFGMEAYTTRYESEYPFVLSPSFGSIPLFPPGQVFPSGQQTLYSGRAFVKQSLYEGNRNVQTMHLAQTALKQSQFKVEAVRLDVLHNTERVFFHLLLAEAAVQGCRERFSDALRLVSAGWSDGWDRVEAESVLARMRTLASQADRDLEKARLEFLKGLNLELDTTLKLVGTLQARPVRPDLAQGTLWAMELRPELQAETFQSQMDAIAVGLALSRRIPSLTMGASYEFTGDAFPLQRTNWDATIGIRFPISYDFWSHIQQKKAQQRQGQIRRAELEDRVRLEVRQAYEDVNYWQKEVPTLEQNYRSLKSAFERAKAQSYRGLAALRGNLSLLEAQARYLEAVYGQLLARSRFQRAVGKELP